MRSTLIPYTIQALLSCTLCAVIFVFSGLSLLQSGVVRKRQAPWLVPFTVGFGLMLLSSGFGTILYLMYGHGNAYGSPPAWLFRVVDLDRIIGPLSLAFLAWGAFLLWKSFRAADTAPLVRSGAPPADAPTPEGAWPPPPTQSHAMNGEAQ